MRAFIVTDTHFGVRSGNLEWQEIQSKAFYDWIIPYVKKHAKEGDIFLHCGDVFESRQSIPIRSMNVVEDILEKLGSFIPVHILLGNHDCHELNSTRINSVRPYKWMHNVTLYEEPAMVEWGGKSVLIMPWRKDAAQEIETFKQFGSADYLFCHTDVIGAKLNRVSKVEHGNDLKEFSGYKRVFTGHIHYRQIQGNVVFMGCPYHLYRSDIGNDKGIWIVDFEKDEYEFIPNPISPKFQEYSMQWVMNQSVESFQELIGDNFIDLYLDPKLALSFPYDRFESLFETKRGFKYKTYDIEEDPDEFDLPQKIQTTGFDIKELAKEHIKELEYADDVKQVLMTMFNDVYGKIDIRKTDV